MDIKKEQKCGTSEEIGKCRNEPILHNENRHVNFFGNLV